MLIEASSGELVILILHSVTFQLHATHTPLTQLASPLQRIVSGGRLFFLA